MLSEDSSIAPTSTKHRSTVFIKVLLYTQTGKISVYNDFAAQQ